MENVRDRFEQACLRQAGLIWWEARTALVPADIINKVAKNDEEFMKLMDEREAVLSGSYAATYDLHQLAKEFHPKNTEETLKTACEDIKEFGKEEIEKAQALSRKFLDLIEEYHVRTDKK